MGNSIEEVRGTFHIDFLRKKLLQYLKSKLLLGVPSQNCFEKIVLTVAKINLQSLSCTLHSQLDLSILHRHTLQSVDR